MAQLNGLFEDVTGWNLVSTLLLAKGYAGRMALTQAKFSTKGDLAYIHRGNSNVTHPVTPEGDKIGTGGDAYGETVEYNQSKTGGILEAANTWIYTDAATDIDFDVTGAEW